MTTSEARTPLRWSRRVATGIPLLLGGVDGALLAGIVIDAGSCTDHCFAGVVLSVVAPVATPLWVATVESRAVGVLTVVAVLVALASAVWWWRTIIHSAVELVQGRRWPAAVFWALWIGAVAATYAVALVASGLYTTVGVLPALAVEVVVWGVVVSRLRAVTSRRRASDRAG